MPSTLISNFIVNINAPIDSRITATNSIARNNIEYKYDGMQVFTADDRIMWTYNSVDNTWTNAKLKTGIYGGSGSLIGNTYVDIGGIGNFVGSQSNYFILSGSSSNKLNFSNYYNRHTATGDWTGVEMIQKFSVDGLANNSCYISFNPTYSVANHIEFGANNSKKFTILSDNGILIYSPTYSAKFLPSSLSSNQTYSLPDKSGIIAMDQDLNFKYVLSNGNTASNPIIILNNVGSTLYKGMLDSGSVSFYKGNTFSSSLDNNGVLKLGNSVNQYVASIVSATLSNNFTYSLPEGGGIFAMKKYSTYQRLGLTGYNNTGTTYSIFTVEGPSSIYGDFIVTSVIQYNATAGWGTAPPNNNNDNPTDSPYINIGITASSITASSYTTIIKGSHYQKGSYAELFDSSTTTTHVNIPLTSGTEVVLLIATASITTYYSITTYNFDIYINGFYTKL